MRFGRTSAYTQSRPIPSIAATSSAVSSDPLTRGNHRLRPRPVNNGSAYPRCVPDAALEELARFIAPMLASAGPGPTEEGWALEVKWDGMRAQLRYEGFDQGKAKSGNSRRRVVGFRDPA